MTRPETDTACPAWLADLRAAVRRHIDEQGTSQAALARHLGISAKHMNQVLLGNATGSPQLLDRIAAAAGLRIAVVAGDCEPAPLPPRKLNGWPARD